MYCVLKIDGFGQQKYLTLACTWTKQVSEAWHIPNWQSAALAAERSGGDVAIYPMQRVVDSGLKRILLTLALALFAVPAIADDVVYWPATRERVYVVDIQNIGPYGTITKPSGIDRIVVRQGNKWGTLPSRFYSSKPAPAHYRRIR